MLPRVVALCAFALSFLGGSNSFLGLTSPFHTQSAFAQTINPINNATDVDRTHDDPFRNEGDEQFHITRADCLADDVFTFDLQVPSPNPANSFQVWASDGRDCTAYENRVGEDALCWKVYQGTIAERFPVIPIEVRDIAARQYARDIGGATSDGTIDDCDNGIETQITLYFMHVNATEGTGITWPTRLDLRGPVAPDGVSAGIGDKRLVVSWTPPEGSVWGYRLYCEESGGALSPRFGQLQLGQATPSLDAGSVASPGTGNGIADSGTTSPGPSPAGTGSPDDDPVPAIAPCETTLEAGRVPSIDDRMCGEVNTATSGQGTATGLENGQLYAVAVSAVDDLGNPGPLSLIQCESPQDLEEFFESYRQLGGQGGGGFCALNPSAAAGNALPRATAWSILFLAVTVCGLVRRWR